VKDPGADHTHNGEFKTDVEEREWDWRMVNKMQELADTDSWKCRPTTEETI
jgi:hypothetical protein